MKNALSVGWMYRHGHWRFDFAYQHAFDVSQQVGVSDVKSGEFSNSRTEVAEETFVLTTSYIF
jgi:hypothetical protein